jgi:hypothetical protein
MKQGLYQAMMAGMIATAVSGTITATTLSQLSRGNSVLSMEDNMPITMPVNGMNFPAGDFKQGMPMMENGMQQMPFNGMQQPPMGNMQMNTQMRMPQMPMFNQGSGNMNKGPSFNKEGEDSSKFMHQGPGQMNQGNQMMPMMNGMQQMPFNGMQQPPMGNMQMNTQMRMPQMPMFNQGSGNMNKGPSFNKEGEDSSKFMHQGPGQMNQGNQMMPMMNGMQGGGQNSMQTDPNLQKLLNMNFDSGDHITSEQRTKLQAQLKKLQKALAKVDSDLAKAVKKIEKEVAKQQKNLSAQLAKAQKMLAAASTDTDKTQIQSYIDQLNEFKIPSVEDRKADLLEMAEQKKSDIQDAIDEINDYLESADSSEE